YLGECDEIPQQTLKTIEDRLLQTVRGNDHPLVRRRALEALGFSGRAEVPVLIEDAFTSEDDEWVASALLAMGRSIDKRWGGDVLEVLNSSSPLVRMEAARAAGELEIEKAVSFLFVLLDDADSGVRGAAIWSLSQIGGEGVTGALEEMLENTGDSGEAALLETALDNLVFTEEFRSLLKPLTLHPLPAYRGG
ncbi:MAG: HEAT repeat domain-containing protein, partial [Anaerolineales bacterium]